MKTSVLARPAGMIAAAAFLFGVTACSSGPGAVAPSVPAGQAAQRVSGTLQIALPPSTSSASGMRRPQSLTLRPLFVSGGTTHAAVFIDQAPTAAGSTTTCSASAGTGIGCTISWSATLGVPGLHTFAVEIDGPNLFTPTTHNVLAEGEATYTVVAGSGNSLGNGTSGGAPLSLNGVAALIGVGATTCPTGASCTMTFSFSDAAGYTIFYGGTTTVPTQGAPTSGNVFDNNGGGSSNFAVTSDAAAIGTLTGSAQTSGSNVFSTFASGTLTVVGVPPAPASGGEYTLSASCVAGATGTFGLKFTGGTPSGSGDITATELAGLSPAVSYPSSPATDLASRFSCSNGVITGAPGAASGTININ